MRLPLFRSVALIAFAALAGAASAQSSTPKIQLGGYERALKLMDQGECDKAKDLLFPTGKMIAGDEVAISDIGDCYMASAAKIKDPAAAQKTREIGAGWVLRAADIGIREAQATAVKLYLDNKIFFVDPYEAGKWYLLWQNNRSQLQLGKVEFDAELSKQLNAYGPDIWNEARARAKAWKPTTLKSETDAP